MGRPQQCNPCCGDIDVDPPITFSNCNRAIQVVFMDSGDLNTDELKEKITKFVVQFPERLTFVLDVNPATIAYPNGGQLAFNGSFFSLKLSYQQNPAGLIETIARDNGDSSIAVSNDPWGRITTMVARRAAQLADFNATSDVAIAVDNTGSMITASVRATVDRLVEQLKAAGKTHAGTVSLTEKDIVCPFLTTPCCGEIGPTLSLLCSNVHCCPTKIDCSTQPSIDHLIRDYCSNTYDSTSPFFNVCTDCLGSDQTDLKFKFNLVDPNGQAFDGIPLTIKVQYFDTDTSTYKDTDITLTPEDCISGTEYSTSLLIENWGGSSANENDCHSWLEEVGGCTDFTDITIGSCVKRKWNTRFRIKAIDIRNTVPEDPICPQVADAFTNDFFLYELRKSNVSGGGGNWLLNFGTDCAKDPDDPFDPGGGTFKNSFASIGPATTVDLDSPNIPPLLPTFWPRIFANPTLANDLSCEGFIEGQAGVLFSITNALGSFIQGKPLVAYLTNKENPTIVMRHIRLATHNRTHNENCNQNPLEVEQFFNPQGELIEGNLPSHVNNARTGYGTDTNKLSGYHYIANPSNEYTFPRISNDFASLNYRSRKYQFAQKNSHINFKGPSIRTIADGKTLSTPSALVEFQFNAGFYKSVPIMDRNVIVLDMFGFTQTWADLGYPEFRAGELTQMNVWFPNNNLNLGHASCRPTIVCSADASDKSGLFAFFQAGPPGAINSSVTCFDYGELPPFWSIREIYGFFSDEEHYYYVTRSVYNPPDQSAEFYSIAIWKSTVTNRDSFGNCQGVSLPKQLPPPIVTPDPSVKIDYNNKYASGRNSVIPTFRRKDPSDTSSPIIATKITFFDARSFVNVSNATTQRRIITSSMDLSTGATTIIKDLDLNDYFTDINSENTTSLGVRLEYSYYDFSYIGGNVFMFSDYEVKEGNVLKLYDKIVTVSQNGNLIEDHETLIREYEGVGDTIHETFISRGPRWTDFATMNDPDKQGIEFNQFFCPPSHLSPIQPQTVVWRKF